MDAARRTVVSRTPSATELMGKYQVNVTSELFHIAQERVGELGSLPAVLNEALEDSAFYFDMPLTARGLLE
ncbi:hypothetical protein, partial [Corallococcus terminator]